MINKIFKINGNIYTVVESSDIFKTCLKCHFYNEKTKCSLLEELKKGKQADPRDLSSGSACIRLLGITGARLRFRKLNGGI